MAFKVGFIGLGIMGSRMAANVQARRYTLIVFNRTRDKAEALLRGGATWGKTPAGVAAEADVLVTMLANPEAVEAAALGTEGFLRALRPGAIWVNSGTVNPSFARRMAEEARANGVRYLDAPVTGSKDAAAAAQLLFMVGGDATDLEVCRPLLSSMATRTIYVGGHRTGQLRGGFLDALDAEGSAPCGDRRQSFSERSVPSPRFILRGYL